MRYLYSVRTSTNPIDVNLELGTLKDLVSSCYKKFLKKGFFDECFGYHCVDDGFCEGTYGNAEEINATLALRTGKTHLWPLKKSIEYYSEDDLFDIIEFLYEAISEPVTATGWYHDYNKCGTHYKDFNKENGTKIYIDEINKIILSYGDGYQLNTEGHIVPLLKEPFVNLFDKKLPTSEKIVQDDFEIACEKFKSRKLQDRKEAIIYLGRVLEFLRPQIKDLPLTKDEDDLFNILNNFGIRHCHQNQKIDYEQSIFVSWTFYELCAAIHAIQRLLNRNK